MLAEQGKLELKRPEKGHRRPTRAFVFEGGVGGVGRNPQLFIGSGLFTAMASLLFGLIEKKSNLD